MLQELESLLSFEASGLGLDPSRPVVSKYSWAVDIFSDTMPVATKTSATNQLQGKLRCFCDVTDHSYARNLFDFRFNSLPRGVTASGNGVELKAARSPRLRPITRMQQAASFSPDC